jgi:hypothetical protein
MSKLLILFLLIGCSEKTRCFSDGEFYKLIDDTWVALNKKCHSNTDNNGRTIDQLTKYVIELELRNSFNIEQAREIESDLYRCLRKTKEIGISVCDDKSGKCSTVFRPMPRFK